MDRAVRESLLTMTFDYLMTQHGADSAVHIANRQFEPDGLCIMNGRLAQWDEMSRIQRLIQAVILRFLTIHAHVLA